MKTHRICWAVVALMLLALAAAPLWAQSPAAVSAEREGCLVQVDGRPAVLTWALGLSEPAEIEAYANTGFNTVYLRLTDGSEEQLDRVSRFATAAEDKGLLVIFALAPRPLKNAEGNDLLPDPTSDDYREAVSAFVTKVNEGLGDHPRQIAWAIEALPNEVVNSDEAFASYLQDWYPSIAAVNDSWGTEYQDWEEISLSAARDVDAALPSGVGRASLDYAAYCSSAYADTISLWANALQAAAQSKLIFAASVTDYRSIISAPDTVDGIVVATLPSVAENDWETHNIHAVDIARQGNRFAAVQTLTTGEGATAGKLQAWAGLALAHGATGLAFTSWASLRDNADLGAVITKLRDVIAKQSFPRQPKANAAILYEPYAAGANGPNGSLYGYLDGFLPGSPTNLFDACCVSSRYGIVDVIGQRNLSGRDSLDYGVIIAPAAFFLTTDQQLALQSFVARGGVLVADAGIGMYQANGSIDSMPNVLRDVLGLRYEDLAALTDGPQQTGGVKSNPPGGFARGTRNTEENRRATARRGLFRFAQLLEEFLSEGEVSEYFDESFVGQLGQGVRVNPSGDGLAIYSPRFLYENWRSTDSFFNEFHDRILAFGSDLEIVDPEATWPGVAVARYDDGSVGIASPNGNPVSVFAYGDDDRVYFVPAGAVRIGNPDEREGVEILAAGQAVVRAQPLPIYVYPEDQGGEAGVIVNRYGRDGIELLVSGTGGTVPMDGGRLRLIGGAPSMMRIELRAGAYPLGAASIHRVTVEPNSRGQKGWTQDLMPDADTGALLIEDTFTDARITITPAPVAKE